MSAPWESVRLRDTDAVEIILGQSPPSGTYNGEGLGLPFYQGKADFGARYPCPRVWCRRPSKIALKGDVLVSVRAPVGDVNIASEECAIGRGLAAVRPCGIDGGFLYYALLCAKPRLAAMGTGSTFKAVNRACLESLSILAPVERSEQRQIATFLHQLQRAIEIEERRAELLAKLKSATAAKLFREGLRGEPLKETEIGQLPASWTVEPLEKLARIASGATPSKSTESFWAGAIPWASPKDMKLIHLRDTIDHISAEALNECLLVPEKTIFIVVRGMVLAKDVPIAMADVPMAFNQDMKAILPHAKVNPHYLLHAMISRKSSLKAEIGTSAHGTRRLGGSSIARLMMPVAQGHVEQREIAAALDALDRLEAISRSKREGLTRLFSASLERLMTGELRLPRLETKEASHA